VLLAAALVVAGVGSGLGVRALTDDTGEKQLTPVSFRSVSDDTGALRVRVPSSWGNVWGDGWHPRGFPPYDGRIGPGLNASPNNARWRDDLTTPGLFLGASSLLPETYTPTSAVQRISIERCKTGDGGSYRDARFDGAFVRLTCPGSATTWYSLAAWPADHSFILSLQVKLVSDADRRALDEILASFEVTGTP
jgi:hypothetical protein